MLNKRLKKRLREKKIEGGVSEFCRLLKRFFDILSSSQEIC
jgi:hypothetical protein